MPLRAREGDATLGLAVNEIGDLTYKDPDMWAAGVRWRLRKIVLAGIRTQDVELTPRGQGCFSSPSWSSHQWRWGEMGGRG